MKLQGKLFLVLIPLAAASLAAVLLLSRGAVNAILLQGVGERGVSELADVSREIEAAGSIKDEKILLPILNESMSQAQASYAMVLDLNGKVLAHTNVVEKGKTYADPTARLDLRREK